MSTNKSRLALLQYYIDNIHNSLFDTNIDEISQFIYFLATIETNIYHKVENYENQLSRQLCCITISRLHCATIVAKLFLNKIPDREIS